MNFLKRVLTTVSPVIYAAWPYLLSLALLAQFSGLVSSVRPMVGAQGIIEAHDNDAGEMVKVEGRTKWWNDNGFRYYGPLYFRVARTWAAIAPYHSPTTTDVKDAAEESWHFALLLTSLMGLYLAAGGMAFLATRNLRWSLLGTLFLVPVLLKDSTWIMYLITAHPDLMLAGLCVLGLSSFAFWDLDLENPKRRTLSAWAWGAALSAKASTLFFLPGLVAVLALRGREVLRRHAKPLFLSGLTAYLVLGFPQNFDVFGTAHFLLKVAVFSEGFRWSSFVEWWGFLASQALPAAGVVSVLALLFPSEKTWTWKKSVLTFLFLQLGFLFMSSKHLDLVHQHYVIPFAAFSVAGWAWVLSRWAPLTLFSKTRRALTSQVALGAVLLGGIYGESFVTPQVEKANLGLLRCRPAFQIAYREAVERISRGETLLATPYTPLPLREGEKVDVRWQMTRKILSETPAQIFILNTSFVSRFLEEKPTAYLEKAAPEWKESRDLFSPMKGASEYRDEQNRLWKKRPLELCFLEIWERN